MKKWTGEWTSLGRARELDEKEFRKIIFDPSREDSKICALELKNMDLETLRELRKLKRISAREDVKERTQGLTEMMDELFFL
jgi:hypothetical protein